MRLIRAVPQERVREWQGVAHAADAELEGVCMRCGVVVPIYWVTDSCWAESGLDPHAGWLCVGCLEAAIGRDLAEGDFA
jgi:hypothetical protein